MCPSVRQFVFQQESLDLKVIILPRHQATVPARLEHKDPHQPHCVQVGRWPCHIWFHWREVVTSTSLAYAVRKWGAKLWGLAMKPYFLYSKALCSRSTTKKSILTCRTSAPIYGSRVHQRIVELTCCTCSRTSYLCEKKVCHVILLGIYFTLLSALILAQQRWIHTSTVKLCYWTVKRLFFKTCNFGIHLTVWWRISNALNTLSGTYQFRTLSEHPFHSGGRLCHLRPTTVALLTSLSTSSHCSFLYLFIEPVVPQSFIVLLFAEMGLSISLWEGKLFVDAQPCVVNCTVNWSQIEVVRRCLSSDWNCERTEWAKEWW